MHSQQEYYGFNIIQFQECLLNRLLFNTAPLKLRMSKSVKF